MYCFCHGQVRQSTLIPHSLTKTLTQQPKPGSQSFWSNEMKCPGTKLSGFLLAAWFKRPNTYPVIGKVDPLFRGYVRD